MFDSFEGTRHLLLSRGPRFSRSGDLVYGTTPFPQFTPQPLRVSIVRPEDFLALTFEFHNFRIEGSSTNPLLVRMAPGLPAYMIVDFPSQHIAEEALYEADKDLEGKPVSYELPADFSPDHPYPDTPQTTESLPVRARLAGPSRLVFQIPVEVQQIEYKLSTLLAKMEEWRMNLAPVALPKHTDFEWQVLPGELSDDLYAGLNPGLQNIGEALSRQTAENIREVLTGHVARTLHQTISSLAEEAGLDIVDIGGIVEDSVQAVAAGISDQANEVVSRMDASDLFKLGQDAINGVIEKAAGRVSEFEMEAASPPLVSSLLKNLLIPTPPHDLHTALELPYRLYISPNKHAGWKNSHAPVEHQKRTELWHTRMGILWPDGQVREDQHPQRTIRAIWSLDYPPLVVPKDPHELSKLPDHSNDPFRSSLTARDRGMLVGATAVYDLDYNNVSYIPIPAYTRRLMLSSLGGWLDAAGSWDSDALVSKGVELQGWKHIAGMGRDQYVRVIYGGYLFPFGHDASLIKVTERKFSTHPTQGRVAFLRQRFFIVVRRPVREFPGQWQKFEGRHLPFQQVRVNTIVTPNLDDPGQGDGLEPVRVEIKSIKEKYQDQTAKPSAQALFWPMVGGKPFAFEMVATDLAGRELAFSAPVIFISKENGLPYGGLPGSNPWMRFEVMGQIMQAYRNADKANSSRKFGGQIVRYAPAPTKEKGDTDLETDQIWFDSQFPEHDIPDLEPFFYPKMRQATVRVAALQRILGEQSAIEVRFSSNQIYGYLQHGLDAEKNKGQVFLEHVDNLDVKFGSGNNGDKAGGLATPDFGVSGLSAVHGPVGGKDISKVAQGAFNPMDYFKSANFLGGLSLADILEEVDFTTNGDLMPRMSNKGGENNVTILFWETIELKSDKANLFIPLSGSKLTLDTTITMVNNEPSINTTARLVNFRLSLFGFIILWFENFEFISQNGKKPDVNFDLHPDDGVTFGGPLEFINELRKYIPSDGFSDPPDLAVTPAGLTASYTLGLPPIEVGVFSLENIKLGGMFKLPFDGSLALARFNFAERHDTFIITVSALGGGGFFAVSVSTDGVKELEAALEIVGKLSIDVGVASGGVYIKAGIYFNWQVNDDGTEVVSLTGYVELGGSLSIIGLITVSLTFYMSLTYTDQGKVWGQATLVVEVEVLCFSGSVSVTVEKQFKGSKADPRFEDLYDEDHWQLYCDKFAPEAIA